MAIQKNFVIKNGLEVDTNLIVADAQANKVGIGTTVPQYTLHVNGGIGATSLNVTNTSTFNNLAVTGISTFNNIVLDGYVSIAGTTGFEGQVLVSTGVGVTWSKFGKDSLLSTSAPGQDTFLFTYDIGSVEIYINGVRLAPTEFEATNGSSIILNDPCFGGETVEILVNQVIPDTVLNITSVNTGIFYPVFVSGAGNQTPCIRTTATAFSFNASTGTLTVGGDLNSGSDERLKKNIVTIENALETIENLRGVRFNWKESGRPSLGVIAQELEKVIPDLVSGDENKTVTYNGLIAILIEALKELKERVDILEQNSK